MWQTMLFSLVSAVLVHALAVQVPFTESLQDKEQHTSVADHAQWSLNELPNPNATDHLVFETVYSLLQHFPNTRMRNGHNIVPGIVQKGTLLYHGRPDNTIPEGPEWVATDPEHSYLLCRDLFNGSLFDHPSGGWHLTLMVTRPLKVVYFDGSSAVKLPYGSMDTQDLITWGSPSTGIEIIQEEIKRIQDLCDWGRDFGVDGFVRMEMDFEIMLCNFTAGVRVVSFDRLASEWFEPLGISSTELFEVINAGTWHNRFPGETRIQLDLPGMVSFYDTNLAPSLVPIRVGQERWDHRAANVSSEDLATVKSRLEANLIRSDGASSGIDWKTLIQVIVDRYAQRLELTQYLLSSPATTEDETLDLAKKAQTQLRIMLTPYILLSAIPTSSDKTSLDWTIPVYKLCSTAHTRSMESQFDSMTDAEYVLLQAVRGTSQEICRVLTRMWAAGVYVGIDPSLNTDESPDVAEVAGLREIWQRELNGLMTWLDWGVWAKCNPGCGPEETCYLPTWPIGFPWFAREPARPPHFPIDDDYVRHEGLTSLVWRTIAMQNYANGVESAIKPQPDEWIRPEPRCIRQVKPYTY